jgi:hypothetical protein
MFLNKFDEWANNQPDFIRNFAIFFGGSSDLFYKMFQDYNLFLSEQKITNVSDIDKWLGLYRNHRRLNIAFKDFILNSIKNGNVILTLCALQMKELSKHFNIDYDVVLNNIKAFSSDDKEFLLNLKEIDLKKSIGNPNDQLALPMSKESLLNIPEFNFIARVWFPCLVMYGQMPSILYRKARLGDLEAICQLLRIDKAIIRDKKISERINKFSMNSDSEEFRQIQNSIKGTLKVTSPKKMKMQIASLISKSASSFGLSFTAPQIQSLFDIISQSKNPDYINDPDMQITPHAFYMNLSRSSSNWDIIPDLSKLIDSHKK